MMRLVLIAVLCACACASGGVIKLKDGASIEGDLKRVGATWEVTQSNGKIRIIPDSDVLSIAISGTDVSDPREAAERLASLRRSVDAMSDIAQIMQRYETLIGQISKTPSANDARADLQKWRDRQAQGMRKIGKDWLTPDTVAAIVEQNRHRVVEARDMVKARRLRDAAPILDAILQSEPANVSALYLKGINSYRQDQIAQARRCFEQAVAAMPDSGPALNNLATTQWRQNNTTIALANLQRAMVAMPLNSVIHDNVAEALNGVRRDIRESAAGKRLQSQFEHDEQDLQASMAKSGWYRWGSTWVTQEQLKQVRQEEEAIRARKEELSKDYDTTTAAIQRIDASIRANERTIAAIEASAVQVDSRGQAIRTPYPASYYDLKRDIDELTSRRAREMEHLESLRAQAREVQAKRVMPPYSGQLKLLDEQSMPNAPTPARAMPTAPMPATMPVRADPVGSEGQGLAK